MSEGAQKATREMLIESIDDEYNGLQKGLNEDAALFAYRKESNGYIRDALYNMPIPDELLGTACRRGYILQEGYLFWTELAARGDTAMDKTGLAMECARLWLAEVRNEYRQGLLVERVAAEHTAFIEAIRLKTPDEIIENAWKICCYSDIHMQLEEEEIETRAIDALLTLRSPLEAVYEEFLQRDLSSHMSDVFDVAMDIAQLQRENLAEGHLPEDAVDERYVSEYLEFYGATPPDDETEIDAGLEP